MKKSAPWIIAIAVLGGAFYFYRSRKAAQEAAAVNPNASSDTALGYLASGYARETGAIADKGSSNERYNSYLDYLKTGGYNSGKSFDEYLTASNGQSLPSNS